MGNKYIFVRTITDGLKKSTIIVSIMFLITSLSSPFVYAMTATPAYDEDYYSSNDILFYDPNACTGASTAAITSATGGSLGGATDSNIEAVLNYFTAHGLPLAAAAGFVGNMIQESGVNPAAVQPSKVASDPNYQPVNGTGFGLVQWTFTGRQQGLVDLAKSTGRNTTDMTLQLDYVWQELNGGYKSTLTALAARGAQITPTEAAIIVHGNTNKTSSNPAFSIAPSLGYEASGDTADAVLSKRAAAAEQVYTKYVGKIKDGAGINLGSDNGTTTTTSTPVNLACGGSNAGGVAFTAGDLTFPIIADEALVKGGSDGNAATSGDVWCYTSVNNCHHDYNAIDLMAPEGTVEVAVRSGTVESAKQSTSGAAGGPRATIQFRDDTGVLWFYTHGMPGSVKVSDGQKVTAGTPLMQVGNSAAADDTPPHLHLDALPAGTPYRMGCAGAACASYPFINIQPLFKTVYDSMISKSSTTTTPTAP